MRKHVERITKSIEILFFALFLTVPLAMHPHTSELFELNKMWLVYIYCLIIFALWGTKMILQRKFEIRRTPFDIPLVLFVISQLLSTLFSLDQHTSFWGYYSRFNGGFLSTLCYVFLYYAFVTNILTPDKEENLKKAGRMLLAIFFSGVLVALWGLPSHFGYDPTCLVFRGTFDVSCWTEAFQPKVRMFSTLGQPNWLAAFLLILIPISTSFTVNAFKKIKKSELYSLPLLITAGYFLATLLFYYDMIWTLSQSGFVGFWVGNSVFVLIFALLSLRKNSFNIVRTIRQKSLYVVLLIQLFFVLVTFFTVNPIPRFQQFNFKTLTAKLSSQSSTPAPNTIPTPQSATPTPPAQPALEAGITGSGEIRQIVWKGAMEIWKAYPLFGSGVETYAFAYYKFRPAEHNLTSEWDYLYNKAHNEFLNYLATTGLFGLGSYLAFLGMFLIFAGMQFIKLWKRNLVGNPLLPAFVGSFVGIAVSNFFGFSVVLVNLLMFLIPIFFWIYTNPKTKLLVLPKGADSEYITSETPGTGRVMGIIGINAFSVFFILFLINYWNADIDYALGYNYNRINAFAEANPSLEKAVAARGGEDLYKNELSINLAALALIAAQNKDTNAAIQFATRAKELSDEVARKNPNNVVYWKARTRVTFSLAELAPTVISDSVAAIEKAHTLAPTDAKVLYNQALIYDQVGRKDEALKKLDETVKLKPDYRDAYYAKALFISQKIESEKDIQKKSELIEEGRRALNFILENLNPNDGQAKDLLKSLN